MAYNHGVRILENPTSLAAPITGTAGLQVIVGTAPVNMAKDPYAAANRPILAYRFEEAVEAVGYSDNYDDYTICQSVDASFRILNVAPIVLINVLDLEKHKKNIEEKSYDITDMQVTIDVFGIILDKLVVKDNEAKLVADADYVASFDDAGYVVITLLESGKAAEAKAVTVSGIRIAPEMVTAGDIIGGYDVSTGKETGLELIRQVYPLFNLTPGRIIAPGWSRDPAIGAVIAAKCININGCFKCEAIVDLDCTAGGAVKYTDVKSVKEKSGFVSPHIAVAWPKVKVGGKAYYYSAVLAALTAYMDAVNDDVPSLASNKALPITALCLDDDADTEVVLDRDQANVVNSFGVMTAINQNGFRSWGNNGAAYPGTTDPKDRWFWSRCFFSWWGNSFILTYFNKVDDPANYRLIESICDSENIRGNSYVAQGKCAGCRMDYNADENPITDILNGKMQFKQYLAAYNPAEDILNVLEFSPEMLETALSGGE